MVVFSSQLSQQPRQSLTFLSLDTSNGFDVVLLCEVNSRSWFCITFYSQTCCQNITLQNWSPGNITAIAAGDAVTPSILEAGTTTAIITATVTATTTATAASNTSQVVGLAVGLSLGVFALVAVIGLAASVKRLGAQRRLQRQLEEELSLFHQESTQGSTLSLTEIIHEMPQRSREQKLA